MNDRIFEGEASSFEDILDGGSLNIAKYVVVEEECQYLIWTVILVIGRHAWMGALLRSRHSRNGLLL